MDTEIQYTFSVVNNVSPVVDQITESEKKLTANTTAAKASVDSQNIAFLSQLAAVTAVYGGINMMTRGLHELGLVNDKTAESLKKVSAAVGVVAGGFNMIRGAVKLVNALKNAEVLLAAVETYRAVLKNPAAIAAVAVAGGAAAGVAGYVLGRGSDRETGQSSVTQNFTFTGASQSGQRSVARDTLEIMGG